jgi:hypothetical protein
LGYGSAADGPRESAVLLSRGLLLLRQGPDPVVPDALQIGLAVPVDGGKDVEVVALGPLGGEELDTGSIVRRQCLRGEAIMVSQMEYTTTSTNILRQQPRPI